MVSFYKKEGGGWDWHNIIGGIITALVIALLAGGFNWFLGVRDMKRDIVDIGTRQKKSYALNIKQHNAMARVTKQIGESLWKHLHPGEPYPFADLVTDMPQDDEGK